MKCIICEPGRMARVAEINDDLETLQKTVDGFIEAFYPYEDPVVLIVNEEGKFNGSLPCRAVYDGEEVVDIIFGTFIVAGDDPSSENFSDLSDEMMEKYLKQFEQPEVFFRSNNGKIKAVKFNPNSEER